MFKHILVPTDGSVLSKEAVSHAVQFAKAVGAQITTLYAKPQYQYHTLNYANDIAVRLTNIQTLTPERYEAQTEAKAQSVLGFVERLCRESDVSCQKLSLVNNDPYKAIIEVAEQSGCDLIFMASHGYKGLQGFLLGSETQKVLTHSTIPVLVHRSATQ